MTAIQIQDVFDIDLLQDMALLTLS